MYGYITSLIIALLFSLTLLYSLEIDLKAVGKTVAFLYIIGVMWDMVGTTLKWWTFPEGGTLGISLILPIEEYIFIFVIPLLCVSVYETIKQRER